MSNKARMGLIGAAIVVAVAAFVIFQAGEDDDGNSDKPATAATETTAAGKTVTTAEPAEPKPVVITLKDYAPVGGVQKISAQKGERVRFSVESNAADSVHVHGYDIERPVAPRKPAVFNFPATIEGVLEVESHEAEHAGKPALIARLTVTP